MSNLSILPYCYLIGWTAQNKFYYGVKYAAYRTSSAHPSKFWVEYFTSSERVKEFRKQHGDPDVIAIRATFDPAQYGSMEAAQKAAVIHECKVIRRMNMVYDARFLNCGNGGLGTYSGAINGNKARKLDYTGEYFSKAGKASMISKLQTNSNFVTNNPMQDSWGTLNQLNAIAKRSGYSSYNEYVDRIISVFTDVGTIKGTSDVTGHGQNVVLRVLTETKGKAWIDQIRKDGLVKAAQKATTNRKPQNKSGISNGNAHMWEAISPDGVCYLVYGVFQKFKNEFKILKNSLWQFTKLAKCNRFEYNNEFDSHIKYQ
jgi:hypothetical protein